MTKYTKNEPETIQAMFGSIAKNYDLANSLISFQLHKIWNKRLISEVLKNKPLHYLDLCTGTGEIAFSLLKKHHCGRAYLLDFCEEMLLCAKEKAQKNTLLSSQEISFIQADAQQIPLSDKSVDSVTLAYGIRNVKDTKKCLEEVFRVLNNQGVFGILELTEPRNPLLKLSHKLYLKTILPTLGWAVSLNQEAYRYLCKSIQNFIAPSQLELLLNEVGFTDVKKIPLSGGIATILIAKKNL